ncbi:MAG TPA: DUF4249 domain-containing protein, partial [Puia sp.]|nr:DUF4249 domain-containing protein [Puia sp.]
MRSKLKILPFLLLLLMGQCKQRYDSPYHPPVTGYLVVEGFIAGNAPTQFTLSRVIKLPGDSTIPLEIGAKLQVEGADNSVYPLAETASGVYTANSLPLNPTVRYRLRIKTANGETYLSDPTPYKPAPAIDSVNWVQDPSGVTFYVNTHDPTNATRYYQWDFAETWEYHSAEYSGLKYIPKGGSMGFDTIVERPDSELIDVCYQGDHSSPLLIASTTKLAQDVVYRQQLQFIPAASQKLSVEYSMIVRQHALTDSAYTFLSLMKANTEQLGTIFDAQPSELKGNIHSLTQPDEPVVGYVSAGAVQQQRIFISVTQLNQWGYSFNCERPDTLVTSYSQF